MPNNKSSKVVGKFTRSPSCRHSGDLENPVILPGSSDYKKGKTPPAVARQSTDPVDVTEYIDEIHDYQRKKESLAIVSPNYLKEIQRDVQESFRATLIDWLGTVHFGAEKFDSEFALSSDTLFLTVQLIDRFLSQVPVAVGDLQRVGVAAFFIASKYEDIYAPLVDNLVYWSAETFTREELYDMEDEILKTLDYRISFPTANTFLAVYLEVAGVSKNKRVVNIARFFLEGTLTSCALLKFLPSQLAAAAVKIACDFSEKKSNFDSLWPKGYDAETIAPVTAAILIEKNKTPENLKSVNEKYEILIDNFKEVAAYLRKNSC